MLFTFLRAWLVYFILHPPPTLPTLPPAGRWQGLQWTSLWIETAKLWTITMGCTQFGRARLPMNNILGPTFSHRGRGVGVSEFQGWFLPTASDHNGRVWHAIEAGTPPLPRSQYKNGIRGLASEGEGAIWIHQSTIRLNETPWEGFKIKMTPNILFWLISSVASTSFAFEILCLPCFVAVKALLVKTANCIWNLDGVSFHN